ncbi:MAG: phage holin family protein [Chloroflexi bacterium]|nr:phage holin family protein [Chloroflexota bacterium]
MSKFIVRILINAAALYLAIYVLQPNIVMQNQQWYAYLFLALIFGLVNALIRPLLLIASCPLIVLTLGLGTLIINTALFLLAGKLGTMFNIGFTIPQNQFLYAFLGALIVSAVSFVLSKFFVQDRR